MILELILTPLFFLFYTILNWLPNFSDHNHLYGFDISWFIDLLAIGFYIFPFSLFVIIMGNVLFWLTLQMGWAIIEWAYKKIPGVN